MKNKGEISMSTSCVRGVFLLWLTLFCLLYRRETPVVRCQNLKTLPETFLTDFLFSCKSPLLVAAVVMYTVIASTHGAVEVWTRPCVVNTSDFMVPHFTQRRGADTWLIPLPSNSWDSSRGLIHHKTLHSTATVLQKSFHCKQQKIPRLRTNALYGKWEAGSQGVRLYEGQIPLSTISSHRRLIAHLLHTLSGTIHTVLQRHILPVSSQA